MITKFDLAFSGQKIDKASHLRKDGQAIQRLASSPEALNLIIWKGKILFERRQDECRIRYIRLNHGLLQQADRIAFLGFIEERCPIFLYKLPNWESKKDEYNDTSLKFFDDHENTHPLLPAHNRFIDLKKVLSVIRKTDLDICGIAKSLFHWQENNKYCSRCGKLNEVFENGWELSCIECKVKAFPRTDPVVIMLIEREGSILLGRSSFWPKGMYSCLAGFLEPGECIEDAVRRETFEEVGIKLESVDYVTNQFWPFPHSLMIGCRARARRKNLTIDHSELEQARWFKREELILLQKDKSSKLKLARRGTIANHLIEDWIKCSY